MSKEKQNFANAATAPAAGYDNMNNNYAPRAPPPSYEDSMKQSVAYNSAGYFAAQTSASVQSSMPYGAYGMQIQQQQQGMAMLPGYAPPPCYQMHMQQQLQQQQQQQQQQYFYYQSNAMASGSGSAHNQQPQVLAFAKGAEIRTTVTGAVTVPPPPPGCAPTPAQMAAMQGQPVVVKQQKRSFW